MHHGQEIYTFFNRYGTNGVIGLIISMFLIGFIIYKTFKIGIKSNMNTYQAFLTNIMPNKLKNNKILIYTINNIINIFLLISFNIMVAGFSTYFFQELNLSKLLGSVLLTIIAFITFSKSINGVIKINTYLIPSLIVLIIFLGIKKIDVNASIKGVNVESLYWIISSMLYASYNSITLIPILVSLKPQINTKKEARASSNFYSYNNGYYINSYILINEFIS